MKEIQEPRQLPFTDLGIELSDPEVTALSSWVHDTAVQQTSENIHSTSRDKREYSTIRKTPSLLFDRDPDQPDWITDTVKEMYESAQQAVEDYLGLALEALPNRYAAIGHLYLPGDEASEAHLDYYPSVNCYLERTSNGGTLHIAKSAAARGVEAIMRDAYKVEPIPKTGVLFEGTILPHVVEAIPESAQGVRTSINLTYLNPATQQAAPSHPRYTHARWMNQ